MKSFIENIEIENARLMFRNFSGNATKFNQSGARNFCVVLDPDHAEELIDIGWNVKMLPPRSEDDEPLYYISVAVNYAHVPPHVNLVTNRSMTELSENTIGSLDSADIENVDLVIRPYKWEVNGKTGIKAYLKTMYVKLASDRFAAKYDYATPSAQIDDMSDDEDVPF